MMTKKLAWFFLPALGAVCLWAGLSENESLAEGGERAAWTIESKVVQAMRQNPFKARNIQEVSMLFWTEEDCASGGVCYANNPYSVYGVLARPFDPLEKEGPCTKLDMAEGTCTRRFQMSGNDVIVVVGKTISDARYMSFQLYQIDRYVPGEGREETESSIGLGINNLTLNYYGPDPFDGYFVMIVSASTAAGGSVKDYFINSGVPPGAINEYYFHRDFANGRLVDTADNLTFMYRITCAEDAALAAFLESTPLKYYLIQGETSATGDVDSMEEWAPRPDSTELDQEDDLMTLLERIILHYWPQYGMPHKVASESIRHMNPNECRAEDALPGTCHYETPDALYNSFNYSPTYGISPQLDDEDDFVLIVGVNHTLFGLNTYYGYFVYPVRHSVSSPGFIDSEVAGSAQPYWPEAGDRFFAYKFGLNCEGDPWCVDIASLEQAIEPGENFNINGRIYLDPLSMTGPNPSNFVPSIMLWYKGN